MKTLHHLWLFIFILSTGCTLLTPTPVSTPTATVVLPSPTVDISAPESVGRIYLGAWEQETYEQMYNLLSPTLRAGLSLEDFESAHRSNLNATTTLSVTLTPTALSLEGDAAWIQFTELWHTAIFGALKAENQLNLVREQDQWWIQWQPHTIWPDLKGGNVFVVDFQVPPRANIYDRNGAGLAIPSAIVTVGVIPDQIVDETTLLTTLSSILSMSPEDIQAIYAGQPSNWYIPIQDISGDESLYYNELFSLPGIERRERAGRLYPQDGVGAHVVGWLSLIPAEQLEVYRRRGYRDDAWVGISGLEAWGETILAGRNGGRLYIVDTDRNYVRSLAERQPERGRAIYTTLDRDLQQAAEQILGDRRGAMVAMDVNTGGIIALASAPGFDNNIFIHSTDEWERQSVLSHPDRPLLNRATLGLYPSGSVFKIVTLAAALEAGGLTSQMAFTCPGYWDGLGSPNRKFCWLTTGHGTITLQDALSASCNVTFYEVGKHLDGLDQNLLPTYARAFGLGQLTGLEEIAEAEGLVPDPEWKFSTYQEIWGTGDTVNLCIGQGFLLVNPLQVARMLAAVANGGTLYRAHLVERIAAGNGIPEQVTTVQATGTLPISKENLHVIRTALLGVTTLPIGTATHRFGGLDIPVAGKTGTAESPISDEEPHSWFAGYFPADDPQIALAIIVENAGEGSDVAAPMFRQMVETYYGLSITPLPEPSETPQGD
ncbi:MAG: penicillin-binding protein 2 [Anaerolineae bacterium]|nr:penicillin-binding protein 2 [Anaerolineae bacterium]